MTPPQKFMPPAAKDVLKLLESKARPDQLEGMARFGLVGEKRLGVAVPEMRKMAKQLGRNHSLALSLWDAGISESRILASMIDEPGAVTEKQMDDWVREFDAWDVCDQVCMNLFDKTPHAWKKAVRWSTRKEEFIKRAAFALMACLAWHDKEATDDRFIKFLPIIKRQATDERNFVKKAVNWSLRSIGKRNPALCKAAMETAREISRIDSRAARWIASDALRELVKHLAEHAKSSGIL